MTSSFSKAVGRHRDTVLVIVGKGPLEEQLKIKAKSLGIENKVMFLGSKHPDEIPYYMSAADIFVLSSLAEGMPNVVMEAMASQKAVIATKVGGIPELVGKNGILVRPKSSRDIAEALNSMLKNPKKAERFGRLARESIIERGLTWQATAKKYREIYQEVLGKRT